MKQTPRATHKFNMQLDNHTLIQKLRQAEPFYYQRGMYNICVEYVHLGLLKQTRQTPGEKLCCSDARK